MVLVYIELKLSDPSVEGNIIVSYTILAIVKQNMLHSLFVWSTLQIG